MPTWPRDMTVARECGDSVRDDNDDDDDDDQISSGSLDRSLLAPTFASDRSDRFQT
jgi:hypothetical protein